MQTDTTSANNSQHCRVLLANNVASVCMGLKIWPVSNYTQQVPTLLWFPANGRNKSTLLDPTMLGPFAWALTSKNTFGLTNKTNNVQTSQYLFNIKQSSFLHSFWSLLSFTTISSIYQLCSQQTELRQRNTPRMFHIVIGTWKQYYAHALLNITLHYITLLYTTLHYIALHYIQFYYTTFVYYLH